MKIYKVKFERDFHNVKKGEVFELRENDFSDWFRKITKIAQRESKAFVKGLSFYRNGRVLFTWTFKDVRPAKPVWKWKLTFWIHGTYEGDDIPMGTKFTYKPTQEEIEKIMWKQYQKHCPEPEEVFPNMKSDYTLNAIN